MPAETVEALARKLEALKADIRYAVDNGYVRQPMCDVLLRGALDETKPEGERVCHEWGPDIVADNRRCTRCLATWPPSEIAEPDVPCAPAKPEPASAPACLPTCEVHGFYVRHDPQCIENRKPEPAGGEGMGDGVPSRPPRPATAVDWRDAYPVGSRVQAQVDTHGYVGWYEGTVASRLDQGDWHGVLVDLEGVPGRGGIMHGVHYADPSYIRAAPSAPVEGGDVVRLRDLVKRMAEKGQAVRDNGDHYVMCRFWHDERCDCEWSDSCTEFDALLAEAQQLASRAALEADRGGKEEK